MNALSADRSDAADGDRNAGRRAEAPARETPAPGPAPQRAPAPAALAAPPLALRAYRGFARFAGPTLARVWLGRRAARGKEDPARLSERFGRASAPRPDGPVIWVHAASVGEAMSALPLFERLRRRRPDVSAVLTTVTRTSAELMAERLPPGVIHQFAPVDTVGAIRAFLDHWRPDALFVLESELWPTMLTEARARGLRTALVSARVSEASAKGWARAPRCAAWLLGQFDLVLAQTPEIAERLTRLGAPRVAAPGALKDAAEPLPVDPRELEAMRSALAARPCWLAASTHPGEETAAFDAHDRLKTRFPGWLTILAPRHPERADAVAQEAEARGLSLLRRSADMSSAAASSADADILLIDRMGELGLWYRVAPAAFIGGSLDPSLGGHNLREAARLGALVLHGPYLESFAADRAALAAVDGARALAADEPLADALDALIAPDGGLADAARAMAARGRDAFQDGAAALDRIWAHLAPLMPPPADGCAVGAEGDDA